MRLVNHHKAHAAGLRKAVGMDGKELRRGEQHVGIALGKGGKGLVALAERRLARQHADRHAQLSKGLAQMEGLVRDQGAQRVHKDAGLSLKQGLACGVHMEDKRLAAARRHDRKGRPAARKGVKRLALSR